MSLQRNDMPLDQTPGAGGLLERVALLGLGRHDASPLSLRPRLLYPFQSAGAWSDPQAGQAGFIEDHVLPDPDTYDSANAAPHRRHDMRGNAPFKGQYAEPSRRTPDAAVDAASPPAPPKAAETRDARQASNPTGAGLSPPRMHPAVQPLAVPAPPLPSVLPHEPPATARSVASVDQPLAAPPVRQADRMAAQGLAGPWAASTMPSTHGAALRPRLAGHDPLPREIRSAPQEPVIEIHIGRIDVRAQVASAAAPAPRSARPEQDRALTRYLAGRGMGARS